VNTSFEESMSEIQEAMKIVRLEAEAAAASAAEVLTRTRAHRDLRFISRLFWIHERPVELQGPFDTAEILRIACPHHVAVLHGRIARSCSAWENNLSAAVCRSSSA
jgi:hypothetical protein